MAKARRKAAKPVPDLVRRQRAIEATMRKFGGRNFKLGKVDCLHLVRTHAVAMGHRGLPKIPDYRSEGGAAGALAKQGVETLEELLDKHFSRITPAAMLPGDVGLVESEPHAPAWRQGSAVISVGRKWLGWHPDTLLLAVCDPIVSEPFKAAWRL